METGPSVLSAFVFSINISIIFGVLPVLKRIASALEEANRLRGNQQP